MGVLPGSAYRALADEGWNVLFISKGIEEVTGYSPEEFTSRRVNYNDFMLPEDRAATREAVFTALRERRMYDNEHRIRHKDGSVRWIWARGHGVFAPDGSLRFIEGWNLDITPRKQAEERLRISEERWRLILDNAHDAFVAMSADGLIAEWNRQAEITFGWPRAEAVGNRVYPETIIIPRSCAKLTAGAWLASWRTTGEEQPLLNRVIEVQALRRDGGEFPAEISIAPVRLGEQYLFSAFIRDVTERKWAERQLRIAKEAEAERARLAELGRDVGIAQSQGDTLRELLQPCATRQPAWCITWTRPSHAFGGCRLARTSWSYTPVQECIHSS